MAASKTWERTKRPDYKEPKETDIVAVRTKAKTKPDNLYPIEVVDEDLTRFKVHYVGFMHLSVCCPTLPLPGNIGGIVGI